MRFILFFLLIIQIFSQENPYLCWDNVWGNDDNAEAYGIVANTDGNLIICGDSNINPWVQKINPDGQVLWEKSFGGSYDAHFRDIIKTADGKFVTIGYSSPEPGYSRDIWIMKINQFGDLLWQNYFDLGFVEYGRSIKQTADGGYILVLC